MITNNCTARRFDNIGLNTYHLAAAHYFGVAWTITDDGKCLGPKHEYQELLETHTPDEIFRDYISYNGFYHEDLNDLVTNVMMDRFSHEASDESDRLNAQAGFKRINEEIPLFPVFTDDPGSGEKFLIIKRVDLDSALYSQLCNSLWVIPEDLLKRYVRKGSRLLFESVLPTIREFRQEYSLYGEPGGPADVSSRPFNTFLKGMLHNGDELIAKASTMFRPCEILSTFDRKTEDAFKFDGETFLAYNVSSHCA